MAVDHAGLLADLRRRVKLLEDDLRERADEEESAMNEHLKAEYEGARRAERTAETFNAWREATLTQAAVAWVLGCVFVRFLEDNELIDEPMIAGAGTRGERAAHRRAEHFRVEPNDSDNDYLRAVFRTVAALPGMAKLYDEAHNPLWAYGISGDAAKALLTFWRDVEEGSGALVHDFTDSEWNTRFLGDLYQDLSESARKRYALLQTPEFVEEFILERTLVPAIEEFGLEPTNEKGEKEPIRLIDPACGSGHFLLGAFELLLARWMKKEPGTGERAWVERALASIYGVDINPFAIAIARFRLVVAALKASNINDLKNCPAYSFNLTTGDSLLHGKWCLTAADSVSANGSTSEPLEFKGDAEQLVRVPGMAHVFDAENIEELERILDASYHVVVGNPPYITVKDKNLNKLYRNRYSACYRQYSIAVPFAQRFFQLSLPSSDRSEAGFVGMITANSFMRRAFGKRLITEFFSRIDLTHVIDASKTHIPGHGTPTVIILGRDRLPLLSTVRTALCVKGEPKVPAVPSLGKVWTALIAQIDAIEDKKGESEWASVVDLPRDFFGSHPWSISGEDKINLQDRIETLNEGRLENEVVLPIGRAVRIAEDEVFILEASQTRKIEFVGGSLRPYLVGENVRDWLSISPSSVWYPYEDSFGSLQPPPHLWRWRTVLANRKTFQGTMGDVGSNWFEYMQHTASAYKTSLSICFAFFATQNHFVLDRGGKVFSQSAPVIKLPVSASGADHLGLIGLLNSSVIGFWMKQVCHNKGGGGIGGGVAAESWEQFYEVSGAALRCFPVSKNRPFQLANLLDRLATERQEHLPDRIASRFPLSSEEIEIHRGKAEELLLRMIALQEELDWTCYGLYGLIDDRVGGAASLTMEGNEDFSETPGIEVGERAFEIVLARRMAKNELSTTWFERHGSNQKVDLPEHWSPKYRGLVELRIQSIGSNPDIGILEQPEYKRRWNSDSWFELMQGALRSWLLDRLEKPNYWGLGELQSISLLAERAQADSDFCAVGEIYTGRPDFSIEALVKGLVESESVPFLAPLVYKPSGMRKRLIWEEVWKKQREEDEVSLLVSKKLKRADWESEEEYIARFDREQRASLARVVGVVQVPPKYVAADFLRSDFQRLRGSLDVPRERFVSYPYCAPDEEASLVIGWAGWSHRQQAIALANHYRTLVEQYGWSAEKLRPVLAGLRELVPWIKQWHNDVDPDFDVRMGDYFAEYLATELQKHGLTDADLADWRPPAKKARKKSASKKKAT